MKPSEDGESGKFLERTTDCLMFLTPTQEADTLRFQGRHNLRRAPCFAHSALAETIPTRPSDFRTPLGVSKRLLLDAQKHAGATRQLELALLGGQHNDADGFCSSDMCDTNLREAIGATVVRRKNPHCLGAVVAVDYPSAFPALTAASTHVIQYTIVHRFSDHRSI